MDYLFPPLHPCWKRLESSTESLLQQFELEGQIQMVNIVSSASCLDADRNFASEALNRGQANISKKEKLLSWSA